MGQGHASVLCISDFIQKQNMQGSSPKFYMSFNSAADLLKNLNFILMEWQRKQCEAAFSLIVQISSGNVQLLSQ